MKPASHVSGAIGDENHYADSMCLLKNKLYSHESIGLV